MCNAFEASGEFQTLVATLYGTSTSDNQRTEQFVNNFYLGAYGRNATSTEMQQQRDALNTAAAQSQASVQAQAETFGRSLFAAQVNDASLTNTQYVTNLYEAFLQRGPDAGGLGFWSGQANVGQGRQNVLNAFATCGAFRELAGTLYREANWLVADQLGTPRMIVNKSGSLSGVKRHDYLPFGEELYAGTGGRTATPQGYSGDSVRQKFTLKERDNETGLDYFGARYYASTQGRFTSADPVFLKRERRLDPQRLNLYVYARNNPTKYIDPTGEDIHVAVSNTVTGTADLHSRTARERRNNPRVPDRVDRVNTYRMTVTNDSGNSATFNVTRDSNRNGPANQMRGNYGEYNENPPGNYRGTWGNSPRTGWNIRMYDPNVPNGNNNTIVAPDGTRRTDMEVHIGTCSEGCTLVRGSSTDNNESFRDAMDRLIAEDSRNGKGTDIYVNIQDRNPNGQPADEPDRPVTNEGTTIVVIPPPPPAPPPPPPSEPRRQP